MHTQVSSLNEKNAKQEVNVTISSLSHFFCHTPSLISVLSFHVWQQTSQQKKKIREYFVETNDGMRDVYNINGPVSAHN